MEATQAGGHGTGPGATRTQTYTQAPNLTFLCPPFHICNRHSNPSLPKTRCHGLRVFTAPGAGLTLSLHCSHLLSQQLIFISHGAQDG